MLPRVFALSLRRYIARHRRAPLARRVAAYCAVYLDAYHNKDYAQSSNGERYVFAVVSRRRNVGCIFDVGANVGDWTLMAHVLCPAADIHCFEVMDATCERLAHRVATLPRIKVNAHGLLDRDGEVALTYFPQDTGMTTVMESPRDEPHAPARGRVERGDTYARSHDIRRVDFLKIDVEGAEHLVLEGLRGMIAEGRVDVIQFEYGTANILSHWLLCDFYRFFEEHGYQVGKIYPDHVAFRGYHVRDEDFRGPNYLAVRHELRDLIAALS